VQYFIVVNIRTEEEFAKAKEIVDLGGHDFLNIKE
jgi:hypothetical protein